MTPTEQKIVGVLLMMHSPFWGIVTGASKLRIVEDAFELSHDEAEQLLQAVMP